jgi:hypothetical protein
MIRKGVGSIELNGMCEQDTTRTKHPEGKYDQ